MGRLSKGVPYGKRFEDYLEAMYILQKEKGVVRVRDLARMLRVKPPSVVEQLEKLSRYGFVLYEKGEYIRLTEKGEGIAKEILKKHEALRRFLRDILMVPEEIADKDACYMEHGLHEITLKRIVMFLEFVNKHFKLKGKMVFLERLKYYYEHGELPDECKV
ncbi:MAG: iron-dependent repressor [Desulfurococcales archaeon ex4484_217_2]|nr:MAG: iron-dependent repressor [Desulfurococcales archaeon ex4484_217_2]